jgi:hypothetical protein
MLVGFLIDETHVLAAIDAVISGNTFSLALNLNFEGFAVRG